MTPRVRQSPSDALYCAQFVRLVRKFDRGQRFVMVAVPPPLPPSPCVLPSLPPFLPPSLAPSSIVPSLPPSLPFASLPLSSPLPFFFL